MGRVLVVVIAILMAPPSDPPATFVFQGVSISYDAAGNRIFRSKLPPLELPGTDFPLPGDTTVVSPPPDPGGGAGPITEEEP